MKNRILWFGLLGIITAVCTSWFMIETELKTIKVYRKAIYEIPKNLDPIKTFTTAENVIANIMYEGLFTIDDSLNVKPQLVQNMSVSADGKTYDFELKQDVLFHDGTRLTSKEVVDSLSRLLDDKEEISIDTYKNIVSILAKSTFKVTIQLRSSSPAFLATLAAPTAKITKLNSKGPYHIGTGPFEFKSLSVIEKTRVLTLKKSPMHDRTQPKIETFEIWELNEEKTAELSAKGFIHDTAIYTTERGLAKKSQSLIAETFAPAAVTWIFTLNNSRAPLDNKQFRACLADGFNKDLLVKKFIPDHKPAVGFLPPTLAGSTTELKRDRQDGTLCRSRFSGQSVSFDYPSVLKNGKEICEHFSREIMESIGVKVHCLSQDFSVQVERIKKKQSDISFLAMTLDLPDVEYFLNTFDSGASFNVANYKSETIDSLLSSARHEPNRAKRAEIFSKINNEVYQNVATINISYPWHISYRHVCVAGLHVGLAGDSFIDYSRVYLNPFCYLRESFNNG